MRTCTFSCCVGFQICGLQSESQRLVDMSLQSVDVVFVKGLVRSQLSLPSWSDWYVSEKDSSWSSDSQFISSEDSPPPPHSEQVSFHFYLWALTSKPSLSVVLRHTFLLSALFLSFSSDLSIHVLQPSAVILQRTDGGNKEEEGGGGGRCRGLSEGWNWFSDLLICRMIITRSNLSFDGENKLITPVTPVISNTNAQSCIHQKSFTPSQMKSVSLPETSRHCTTKQPADSVEIIHHRFNTWHLRGGTLFLLLYFRGG